MKKSITLLFVIASFASGIAQSVPSLFALDEAIVIFEDTATPADIQDLLADTDMYILEGPLDNFQGYLLKLNTPFGGTNAKDSIKGIIQQTKEVPATQGGGLNFSGLTTSHSYNKTSDPTDIFCYSIMDGQTNGGQNINSYIFDTGIARLQSIWSNFFLPNDLGENFIQPGLPIDDHGHGSHISSIIMEGLDNSGSEILLKAYKTQDDNGQGTLWDAIKAIDLAITEEADIVNMSISYNVEMNHGLDAKSPMSVAIEIAREQQGILFIAAAGNEGEDNDFVNNVSGLVAFPASYTNDNIISVASADCRREISSWSNYGSTSVDVLAPGEDILGFNEYGIPYLQSGTSQATAFVTKLATFLGTYQVNFDWALTKCAILAGVVPSPSLGAVLTDGYIDVDNSLSVLLTTNDCQPTSSGKLISNQGNESLMGVVVKQDNQIIEIDSKIDQNCELKLIDITGMIHYTKKLNLSKGLNRYQLDFELPHTFGLYYLNLASEQINQTIRLVR